MRKERSPSDAEIALVIEKCKELGVNVRLSTVWAEGGKGGIALAEEVVRLCEEEKGEFTFAYEDELSIEEKIEAVTKKVYGGNGVIFAPQAQKQMKQLTELGFGSLPDNAVMGQIHANLWGGFMGFCFFQPLIDGRGFFFHVDYLFYIQPPADRNCRKNL